jgi:hypothetical protein
MERNREPEQEQDQKQEQTKLHDMVQLYLASNPIIPVNKKTGELEIRFGTNNRNNPITKLNYDTTVKYLYSNGFKIENNNPKGNHILRIYPEEINKKTGEYDITESRIRAEINGLNLIHEYCNTNSIQKLIDNPTTLSHHIQFTSKVLPKDVDNKSILPVNFNDFQIRISYQLEQDFGVSSNISRSIIEKWSDAKKTFRYMNRVRFSHPEYPVYADLSIIKSSKKRKNNKAIPEYTIQDAGLFKNPESYEIEMEIDNSRVGNGTKYDTPAKLIALIHKMIRIILSALQDTNYPISYKEQNDIIQSYMKMIHGDDYKPRYIRSSDFIGPSSYTLQMENIAVLGETSIVPNIRKNYTVTDKADGERKLLYIAPKTGKIYFININMNVQFTGMVCGNKKFYHTLIDGEHIKYDKNGKYINLYACFDIYYIAGQSVREYAFSDIEQPHEGVEETKGEKKKEEPTRLSLLSKVLITGEDGLSLFNIVMKTDCTLLTIKCKKFNSDYGYGTIFHACSDILTQIKDGQFEYNTDGLIFTPSDTGVGSDEIGKAGPLYKISWKKSFKWKPPEFNTIDFLVSSKRDKNGKEDIHTIIDGQEIIQYKTIILRCGFDRNNDIFINPFQSLIDDTLPSNELIPNEDKYQPAEFKPTNPYDPNACFCNILLHEHDSRHIMKTEEGEYFEEDMIVEFKYDLEKEGFWRWIPIRVRYDKTAELKAGKKNYGNSYNVANNNWHSIHHPITEKMLMDDTYIPEIMDDDVYYNPSGEKSFTRSLRDFHNRYVKSKLINGVSNGQRGITLIDYAVGKAGDLQKWFRANISFVFGIDISRDNIHNNMDGACARYLKELRKNTRKNFTKALFVNGNSSLSIKNGDAFITDKDKQIARAIFGIGPKDRKILGEGVYKQYGIVENGFHISSVQFALHYFFENEKTLHEFLGNVSNCTRVGGYFIGTCYDGDKVFQLLKNKNIGDFTSIFKDDKRIFEITKQYNQTGFSDDETSLGYAIDVYQESINKVFREYLVNFQYMVRILENYGFTLITKEEAEKMHLPNGSGLFSELFTMMENEVKQHPKWKTDYADALYMSKEEKSISFLNRYFVFQKNRDIKNTEKVAKIILAEEEEEKEEKRMEEDDDDIIRISKPGPKIRPKVKGKKIGKEKVELNEYSPIIDSPVVEAVEPVEPNSYKKGPNDKRCKPGYVQDKKDKTICNKKNVVAPIAQPVAPPIAPPPPPPPPPNPRNELEEVDIVVPKEDDTFYIKKNPSERCRNGYVVDKKDKTRCNKKK